MRLTTLLVASLVLLFAASLASAQHRLITQGNDKLAIVGKDGKIEWEMKWGGIHDIHVLPGGNIMVQQGASKVVEIDPKTRQVVWSYDSATSNGNAKKPVEVHAFQPLADGSVMIAESGPGRIIEVNRDGKLLKEIKLKVNHPHPHTDTRLVRKLTSDNYLVCHEGDGFVREYDGKSGDVAWEYEVPMFGKEAKGGHGPEAFGNGHSVLEVTREKKIVWELHQKDLPGITLAWVTTLEVLPNGNYLIGNCHAGVGQPLLIELEPKSKKVVWQFDQYGTFGNSVSNSQVLDVRDSLR